MKPSNSGESTRKRMSGVRGQAKRKRPLFVRPSAHQENRPAEYEAIREAYRKQPDSVHDADDWSTAEEYTIRTTRRR
jgi:hypothetical protein